MNESDSIIYCTMTKQEKLAVADLSTYLQLDDKTKTKVLTTLIRKDPNGMKVWRLLLSDSCYGCGGTKDCECWLNEKECDDVRLSGDTRFVGVPSGKVKTGQFNKPHGGATD